MPVNRFHCLILLILTYVGMMEIEAQAQSVKVLLQGGQFQMGASEQSSLTPQQQQQVFGYFQVKYKPIPNQPAHEARVSSFSIDRFEVTNRRFREFVQQAPEWSIARARNQAGKADNNYLRHWDQADWNDAEFQTQPVAYVSWYAAAAFCQHLSMRLPTEAEWEFAARAGKDTAYGFQGTRPQQLALLNDHVWFYFNAKRQLHPVGSKNPNAYGLADMQGNVWEWVSDWFDAHYFTYAEVDNPQGPRQGTYKVLRGGGFMDGPSRVRLDSRDYTRPQYAMQDVGFRCASSATELEARDGS